MKRIRLALLEVTNGSMPPATLYFERGLNVLSGKENRGKSYVFSTLDFLFGAEDPPEPNLHSTGYELATLYFTLGEESRGVVRREFASGKAEALPYHPVTKEVPREGWRQLAKKHKSKRESLSKYWLTAMGFGPEILRSNASGDIKNLTIRILAHLCLVDEIRILEKRSPLRSIQSTAWPGDDDAFALVLGARANPPQFTLPEVSVEIMPPEVRRWIEAEIARVDDEIVSIPLESNASEDEAALIARRAGEFTAAADTAARELRAMLGAINEAQQRLTEVKSHGIASREIVSRLLLLRDYYESDLRRLAAVNETAFLLEQLNDVGCPTCFQPFDPAVLEECKVSKDYLQGIQRGTRAEASKIRRIQGDLEQTIADARGEVQQAYSAEVDITETISRLRLGAELQEKSVAEAHGKMSQIFADMGNLARRKSLKDRRQQLANQLVEIRGGDGLEIEEPNQKTQIDDQALIEFCDTVANILKAWRWSYTPKPIVVTFDAHYKRMDIKVSGAAKRSFGKAARAILNSAVLVGLMDYCFARELPHPGFVVLDSPLTTKKDERVKEDDILPDEMVEAFFDHLAKNYKRCQVIVIDNKEPPLHLRSEMNLVRFDDGAMATRAGFFG
ncbi:hypothetical protein [Paludisphaera soli]|uniref:hypothetical protein n=1 Tax=Paludisphaera soli TaxID=2712865 RepID=UPI0013EA04B3|nr:hypothetical protein [Paludisphaera soli]